MTTDGMMERSPAVAPVSRASGSTRGWQDRASEVATAPGAFHHSVQAGALAGIAVVPLPGHRAGGGQESAAARAPRSMADDAAACIAPAPDGTVATLIGTGGCGVIVVPAGIRPAVPDADWARWTARTQAALHRFDAAIACRWDAVWPDAPSVVAWLRTRAVALAEELDVIRGRVELVLHLPPSVGMVHEDELAAATGPGGQWLRGRARDRSRDAATRAGRAVDGPLADFATTVRRAVPDAMGESAIVRLLVDHAAVETVRTQVATLREAGLVERLAGPWVPGPIAGHVTS